jgi:beta-glucosidase
VGARLGDRVRHFATLNEPQVVADHGYRTGVHAPGRTDGRATAAAHHLLLGHGLAVEALRAAAPRSAVGIVLNIEPKHPASTHVLDEEAALVEHARANRWYLDPIAGRGYPQEGVEAWGWDLDEVGEDDLATIATPIDFVGVNYYSRAIVRSPLSPPLEPDHRGRERTALGWEVYPDGLVEALELVASRTGSLPLYITENGAAYPLDEREPARDPERVRFLHRHLEAALTALERGLPLRGFFVWSLLDNFEWAHGYAPRFGIVHVDYATMERRVRASGRFLAAVAAHASAAHGAAAIDPPSARAGGEGA